METKLAKELGVSVEEYRYQKDLLDEANKAINIDHDKRIGRDKNLDRVPPYPSLADYSSLPSIDCPPIQDPSQFAIGSRVSVPTQRGKDLYCVVMWIGTLPDFPGVIAGVELVSHIALIH